MRIVGHKPGSAFWDKMTDRFVLIPLLGFFFCILIIGMLNLSPMLVKKDGYVWSPINSRQYQVGDAYYYAAWMMEITEGKLPPGNPSAKENAEKPNVELFKLVPMILSAFPALILSDPRYIFFISFTLFPGILFLLSYHLSHVFTKSQWFSFAVGLIAVFYYWAWYGMEGGVGHSFANLLLYPLSILQISTKDIEYLNDNFRFINISVSSCVLIALILSFVTIQSKQTWFSVTVALILCLAISFTYLPQMVLSYSLLSGFCFYYLISRKTIDFKLFFSLGVCTLIFLLSIGYLDLIATCQGNTHFMGEIFTTDVQGSHTPSITLENIRQDLILNRYFFFWVIGLAAAWRRSDLRTWIIIFIIVGLTFKIIGILAPNPQFSGRFFSRAYDLPWIIFLLIALFVGIKDIIQKYDLTNQRIPKLIGHVLCSVVIVALILFPAIGFARYAIKNTQNLTHYIPVGQWEAYRWLQKNTERDSVVLAIDWNDAYLVPVYTHNNLFFGHYILENRTENDEVRRYLAAWHLLGLPRHDLERIVAESVNSYRLLDVAYLGHPDFPSPSIHESGLFIHGLIYFPYLVKFDGRVIGAPAFFNHVMNLYKTIDWQSIVTSNDCDYILVSNFYWDRAASLKDSKKFRLVYENDVRRIYKVERL